MEQKSEKSPKRRFIKCLIWCFAGFSVFTVAMLASLPLWISPVAVSVAGSVVPSVTGTGFSIERVDFNPYTGTMGVKGVRLSNPEGFGGNAFSLTRFHMEMDIFSVFSDVIDIKEVIIEDPYVSYYSDKGKNNFDVIMANVEKATKSDEAEAKEAKEPAEPKQKKVVIGRLSVSGTKVKLMKSDLLPPMTLPSIVLTDVGKKSGGATLEEAWVQVSAAVMKSMSEMGDGLNALGGLFGDGAKDLSKLLGDGADGMASALDGLGKKKESSAKSSGKSGGGIVSGTVDVTKDVSAGAADAAKKTVDTVGDTATKAAEGVKNLFKGFGK